MNTNTKVNRVNEQLGAYHTQFLTKNAPELRFPEFNDEWNLKQIDELTSVTSGGTPSRSNKEYWNGSIPWITTTQINFNLIRQSEEYITELGLKNSSAKLFPANTILIAMYGQGKTRGKVAILDIEAATNQACAAIKPSSKFQTNYLYQFLTANYETFRQLSNEGGQKNLSGGLIKQFTVSIPKIKEQQKIAFFLSTVDIKITALRRKHEQLERYKRGIMQRLFSQEIRFKQDNGTDFPEWEEKKLGDVINFFKTNNLSRANLDIEEGNIQNIHYGDIHTKFNLQFDQNKEIVPYIKRESLPSNIADEEYCQKGDLIIADASEDYADIGKSLEIRNVQKKSLVAGLHTFLARPKAGEFEAGYLGYFMQTEFMRKQIMRIAQGISVLGISKKYLSKLIILTPNPKEQQKIANFLTSIDQKIDAVSTQIEQMEQFKKGLLQKMFV